MTKKVAISIRTIFEWQRMVRVHNDELSFAMNLLYWLIEQGFVINPDPECTTINVYRAADKIVFEKVCDAMEKNNDATG